MFSKRIFRTGIFSHCQLTSYDRRTFVAISNKHQKLSNSVEGNPLCLQTNNSTTSFYSLPPLLSQCRKLKLLVNVFIQKISPFEEREEEKVKSEQKENLNDDTEKTHETIRKVTEKSGEKKRVKNVMLKHFAEKKVE